MSGIHETISSDALLSNPWVFGTHREAQTYPSPRPSNLNFDLSILGHDLSNLHTDSNLGYHATLGSFNIIQHHCCLGNPPINFTKFWTLPLQD